MIKSRPSVAYKRHSPRQWSQELVLDDVRREEGGQRERPGKLWSEQAGHENQEAHDLTL